MTSSHIHFMVSGMAHAMSDVCTARAVSPRPIPDPCMQVLTTGPRRPRLFPTGAPRPCPRPIPHPVLLTVKLKAVIGAWGARPSAMVDSDACLAELGEGVAHASWPPADPCDRRDEQLAGILTLAVGHRAFEFCSVPFTSLIALEGARSPHLVVTRTPGHARIWHEDPERAEFLTYEPNVQPRRSRSALGARV